MSKKDFVLIADVINSSRNTENNKLMDEVAVNFANRLKTTNPLFNRDKFLKACGVTD